MRGSLVNWKSAAAAAMLLLATTSLVRAQDLPKLVEDQGRATLMVDGAPYFLLGAQVDNSSGWPERLDAVWPAAELLRLNTLEVPVYWEQLEPKRGTFDFTVVDAILAQARAHKTHLVLLWFGTWKNGKMHYVPDWVKSDTTTYPRMLSKSGVPIDVLSPNAPANLDADRAAFTALMRHLKQADPQHTVLMMQVENESGSLGLVRDFSPMAQKIFDGPVPADLLKALNKAARHLVAGLRRRRRRDLRRLVRLPLHQRHRRRGQAGTRPAHVRQQLAQEPACVPHPHHPR